MLEFLESSPANSYVFFLAPLFLSREQAIAFGAMWFFAMAISSAIGG